MEIREINYALAGIELGVIDLEDGTILRCLEIQDTRTMWLHGITYRDGKFIFRQDLQDFRMNTTSIRVQRLDGTRVLEIREFLTSVCIDETAKKAFKALRECKYDLYDADMHRIILSKIDIILSEANLPYIRNAYGTAKAYFRSALKRHERSFSGKLVHDTSLSFKLGGRDQLSQAILEACATKRK